MFQCVVEQMFKEYPFQIPVQVTESAAGLLATDS